MGFRTAAEYKAMISRVKARSKRRREGSSSRERRGKVISTQIVTNPDGSKSRVQTYSTGETVYTSKVSEGAEWEGSSEQSFIRAETSEQARRTVEEERVEVDVPDREITPKEQVRLYRARVGQDAQGFSWSRFGEALKTKGVIGAVAEGKGVGEVTITGKIRTIPGDPKVWAEEQVITTTRKVRVGDARVPRGVKVETVRETERFIVVKDEQGKTKRFSKKYYTLEVTETTPGVKEIRVVPKGKKATIRKAKTRYVPFYAPQQYPSQDPFIKLEDQEIVRPEVYYPVKPTQEWTPGITGPQYQTEEVVIPFSEMRREEVGFLVKSQREVTSAFSLSDTTAAYGTTAVFRRIKATGVAAGLITYGAGETILYPFVKPVETVKGVYSLVTQPQEAGRAFLLHAAAQPLRTTGNIIGIIYGPRLIKRFRSTPTGRIVSREFGLTALETGIGKGLARLKLIKDPFKFRTVSESDVYRRIKKSGEALDVADIRFKGTIGGKDISGVGKDLQITTPSGESVIFTKGIAGVRTIFKGKRFESFIKTISVSNILDDFKITTAGRSVSYTVKAGKIKGGIYTPTRFSEVAKPLVFEGVTPTRYVYTGVSGKGLKPLEVYGGVTRREIVGATATHTFEVWRGRTIVAGDVTGLKFDTVLPRVKPGPVPNGLGPTTTVQVTKPPVVMEALKVQVKTVAKDVFLKVEGTKVVGKTTLVGANFLIPTRAAPPPITISRPIPVATISEPQPLGLEATLTPVPTTILRSSTVVVQSTDVSDKSIAASRLGTRLRSKSRVISKTAELLKTSPVVAAAVRVSVALDVGQRSKVGHALISETIPITETVQISRARRVPGVRVPIVPIPFIPRIPAFKPYRWPDEDLRRRGKASKVMKERPYKYVPDITSAALGIYGKRPRRLTGLERRPILKRTRKRY